MDARTSRYHEVYARWQRDPDGFWAEAARDIDWIEPPKHGVRSERRRLRPLVPGRASATPAGTRSTAMCMRGRGAQAGDHLRFPGHRHEAHHHLRRAADRGAGAGRASCATSASSKGDRVILYMPMVPEAVIAHARLRAHRRGAFGGVRRLRARRSSPPASTTAKPKVILSASCGIEPGRVVNYKPLLDEAIALVDAQARRLPDPAAAAGEATLIAGRDHDWAGAARRRARVGEDRAATACRCWPPIRSTSSTRPARPACRRAWCATTAATWSRSNGR